MGRRAGVIDSSTFIFVAPISAQLFLLCWLVGIFALHVVHKAHSETRVSLFFVFSSLGFRDLRCWEPDFTWTVIL